MKIIGIVARVYKDADGSDIFECLETYRLVLTKYENVSTIMILPPKDINYNETKVMDEVGYHEHMLHKLDPILDMCDGFLIPGGSKWNSHDEYIINYAINADKPVLGICLGMQIMGVMDNRLNNGLFDTTIKNNTNINHCQKDNDKVHKVSIIDNTILKSIIKEDEIVVNSRHNYHIDGVVKYRISAVSEDGLIEGLEYPGCKFVVGVQWHPESTYDTDINSRKIFDRFINSL